MSDYTVLLPLDGDETSEAALLVLPMLRTIGFSKVRIFSVDDTSHMKTYTGEGFKKYQAEKRPALEAAGWTVETVIVQGSADVAIVKAADDPAIDLVLLATHGRTGIKRMRLGSTSDKVIKNAKCPRLVVGPNVDIDLSTYSLGRILVPVDGSDLSEMSLPIAKHLATITGAQIDLLQSVSMSTGMMVGDTAAGVDLMPGAIQSANQYLARLAENMPGLTVNATVVVGSPGDAVLGHLATHPVDLVIMASRGRTGLARAAMGSVTERVLQGPDPVLVFEIGEDRSRLFNDARSA
jgi:nucleotide-binding universal stress UspA family protein